MSSSAGALRGAGAEVHGNSKPENVLLQAVASRLALKLSDFTASCLSPERARCEDSIPPSPSLPLLLDPSPHLPPSLT